MGEKDGISRREFMENTALTGTSLTALLMGFFSPAQAGHNNDEEKNTRHSSNQQPRASGTRKLGSLEVSSIGMGVQNVSRKYTTTVPVGPR